MADTRVAHMGTLDRSGTGEQSDLPKEAGSENVSSRMASGWWLELDGQSNDQLGSAQGRDEPKTPFHRPSAGDVEVPDGEQPRSKPGDPIELPGIYVRRDVGPGIKPPDYKDPDVPEHNKLKAGQEVVVGRQDSEENPRRYAVAQDDGRIVDKDTDGPSPEDPSGEEIVEMGNDKKPRLNRVVDKALKAETIEGANDAAKEHGGKLEDLLGGPKATGTSVGTPDRPIVDHQQQQGTTNDWGMILVGAPAAATIFVTSVVQFARAKLKESRQSRGDLPDADH